MVRKMAKAKNSSKKMIFFLGVGILILLGVQIVYSLYSFLQARQLAKTEYVGEYTLGDTKNPELNILIEGDSVGAGVGASLFENSLASRIASHYQDEYHVNIVNKSKSGNKMKDLVAKDIDDDFDLVILVISSNDLFNFSNLSKFKEDTGRVLKKYSTLPNKVIILGPGRVFDAPAIPLIMKPIYKYYSKKYSKIIADEAGEYDNLFHANPINSTLNPKKYGHTSAKDNFHPNDMGHKFWFDVIKPYLN